MTEQPKINFHLTFSDYKTILKYLDTSNDVLNLMMVKKSNRTLTESFDFNSVSVSSKKLFPNLHKHYLYKRTDNLLPNCDEYHILYKVEYSEYNDMMKVYQRREIKPEQIHFKTIAFCKNDLEIWDDDVQHQQNDEIVEKENEVEKVNENEKKEVKSLQRKKTRDLNEIKTNDVCNDSEIKEKMCDQTEDLEETNLVDDFECEIESVKTRKIVLPNILKTITEGTFNNCRYLKEVVVGDNVTTIGKECFNLCIELTKIQLPSKLLSIGDFAFSGCSKLKEIELPSSLVVLGNRVFRNCHGLNKVIVKDTNHLHVTVPLWIRNMVDKNVTFDFIEFDKDDRLKWQQEHPEDCKEEYLTQIKVPESVNVIGFECFDDCHELVSVTLPSSLKSLKDYAFRKCVSLKEINIPEGVILIGYQCFFKCDKLRNLVIPKSVNYIGDSCFCFCDSLETIVLPALMKKKGKNHVYKNKGLNLFWNSNGVEILYHEE